MALQKLYFCCKLKQGGDMTKYDLYGVLPEQADRLRVYCLPLSAKTASFQCYKDYKNFAMQRFPAPNF
jgi:hypothetical protein